MQTGLGRLKFASFVVAGLLTATGAIGAADLSSPFAGNLLGSVADSTGTPQMGATVQLFDRYRRVIRKTLTSGEGRFGFAGLPPDLYSVRVELPNFLPAHKEKIAVRAGLSSVLDVHLASIFSTVDVQYTAPTGVMSEDWKWVLRSSSATRSILRDLPDITRPRTLPKSTSSTMEDPQRIFSGTRGLISLSAGDAGSLLSGIGVADFGTAFALSTNLYGKNGIRLAGTLGETERSGLPSMGLRATYSRGDGDSAVVPEVTVLVQQVSLPGRPAFIGIGGTDAVPPVRSLSVSYYDTVDTVVGVHAEYGAALESVSYFDRVARVSPFARATFAVGRLGTLALSYSNGGPPTELYIHQYGQDADLAGMVNTLASLPQFSFRDNHLQLQRTRNYEAGFSKSVSDRRYAISGFFEDVDDGRLNVAGETGILSAGDILPDLTTRTSIFNLGHYNRHGVMGSISQKLSDTTEVALAVGSMGGFSTTGGMDQLGSANSFLHRDDHAIASANVRTTLPVLGTRIIGNYEYVSGDAILPRHIFTTQQLYTQPGLDILVRQPLPSFLGMPGRIELSADLSNMLAQGYIPVSSSDGRRLLLVQAPRAIRGGLNFIF